jgi:murein DD-endopeptidase MepM/ murein hydrolase activator NlpD
MTGRKKFRLLSIGGLIGLAGCAGCATSRSPTALSPPPRASAQAPLSAQAELSATEVQDASIVVVSVRAPEGLERAESITGEYEGIDLPFYPAPERGHGVFEAVLGVPYGQRAGVSDVKIKLGAATIALPLKVYEGVYASETLHVDKRHVRPQKKADLQRIKREQHEIGEVYRRITRKKYWSGPFVLPIGGATTSSFGTKRVYNGVHQNSHLGLDLKAATGTPIHAPAAGEVAYAKETFFLGNMVILDHGYGVLTIYGHMSKLEVKKGQVVRPGELLGLAGKTGRATGPHLHWMAVIQKTKVNPEFLTKVMQ